MRIPGLKIYKPVDMTQNIITSRHYDLRRYGLKICLHHAYDFAPVGTGRYRRQEIISGIRAKVIQIYDDTDGFGLYVKLQPLDFPRLLLYKAHLRDVYVKEGDIVNPLQRIALMGNSGNCKSRYGGDGTHIHEELRYLVGRGEYQAVDLGYYYKDVDWLNTFKREVV